MGHLDELYAKYRDRGLLVLAVTNEGKSLVDKFVSDTGSKHPIVIEDGDSAGTYGINGFPTSYLIDANGRIAWTGHPASVQDAEIEKLLQNVRLVPTLPKKLSGVQKHLEKGDFSAARKALDGLLGGTLDDSDRAAAEETGNWIQEKADTLLKDAEAAAAKGDYHAAAVSLRRLQDSFKGFEQAEKAKASLDEMVKDRDRKREIDAGDSWEKVSEAGMKAKPEQAAAAFRAFAKKWEGTKAAKAAYEAAVRMEAKARK